LINGWEPNNGGYLHFPHVQCDPHVQLTQVQFGLVHFCDSER
jgi:hypothetical protein